MENLEYPNDLWVVAASPDWRNEAVVYVGRCRDDNPSRFWVPRKYFGKYFTAYHQENKAHVQRRKGNFS